MELDHNDASTIVLSNADVAGLVDMAGAIAALRVAYDDLAADQATYGPRIDVFAPVQGDEHYYQWGSMAGVSIGHGVLAIRIKSDIVSWPDGNTQEKFCVEPGRYCGLIFAFRIADGAPVAIIQDGYLQHLRVGAAAAIGTDALARRDSRSLGLLGSGGMARVYAQGIAAVRSLDRITVYSPNRAHREAFATEMSATLGIDVNAVETPEQAVHGSDIVATATDAMSATFAPDWLSAGAHVTCVTRRELSAGLLDRADVVVQLGHASLPADAAIPMMEWKTGGMAAYVCGSRSQRERIPPMTSVQAVAYPTLLDLQRGDIGGRTERDQVTLFINTGTQGLQFAAMAGEVLRAAGVHLGGEAKERDSNDSTEPSARITRSGHSIPMEWLLQDIRD